MHTSIDTGFHKDADGMDAALEVVWSDVGSISHQEGQSLCSLHQRTAVPTHQLLSQLNAVLVHAHRHGGRGGGGCLFSVHLFVAKPVLHACAFRLSYFHGTKRYKQFNTINVLCFNNVRNGIKFSTEQRPRSLCKAYIPKTHCVTVMHPIK